MLRLVVAVLLLHGLCGCQKPSPLEVYRAELDECRAERDAAEAECWTLYGPSLEPLDEGDPDKHSKCLIDVTDADTACVRAAINRYQRRVALSRQRGETNQPSQGKGNNVSGTDRDESR